MKKLARRLLYILAAVALVYGAGRLYYSLTAGFMVSNISSDFAFQPQWEVRPLSDREKIEVDRALEQPYSYLGKGCQSYVFGSEDGQYVIKFFKYQRYRIQPWLDYFPPLPAITKYKEQKREKKWKKLDGFVQSWKIAFENLSDESGLLFVHLNKTDHLKQQMTLYDKLGLKHVVDLDQMEFCIQRRADMLCDTLLKHKDKEELTAAQGLVHHLLTMILSEYARGLADNDHALMQNTGVAQGKPVHIDVGQFVINEAVKDPALFQQELFTKTYKFKVWLREYYPELGEYLEIELRQIIGSGYDTMQPRWRKK